MKKILIWILKIIFTIIIVIILYLNISLYYNPTFINSKGQNYNQSVYYQLQHLKNELQNGAGNQMQMYFPEGFLFINSLYGLSWCNTIKSLDSSSPIYQEGIQEINWVINEVSSEEAKNIFDPSLPLSYGAFYTGWTNYLLGSKLSLQKAKERNLDEVRKFKNTCSRISQAIVNSNTPYLESYGGLSWPADNTCAVASLSLHDEILEPKYEKVISDWIDKVKQSLEPSSGLIPHESDNITGASIGNARGSSQSLILNFLSEIDPKFAADQFKIYKALFLDYRFGLPGIREYPKGIIGAGDIDSGPILLEIGGAASIVGQKTMLKFGDINTYKGLRNSIEGFGVGFTFNSRKKYILGKLPIADAFICWSNSVENQYVYEKSNWRIRFQLISIVLILILILVFLFKKL